MALQDTHTDIRLLRPTSESVTTQLFVGNCGPAVGISEATVQKHFSAFGDATVQVPDPSRGFVLVSFTSKDEARAAQTSLDGAVLCGRRLSVKYAQRHPKFREDSEQTAADGCAEDVHTDASNLGIPGLYLYPGFVSEEEEAALLLHVHDADWQTLAKRQVCHFGYEFEYLTRSVNRTKGLGTLPGYTESIVRRMEQLPDVPQLDQLTVNRYPAGVGLAPHVDAHSAFTGAVLSLSLGSTAVMQFRRNGARASLFLPRRSLVVMAGECRYAWEHYIPHRKYDTVGGELIPRAAFRTSFTFRRARGCPCDCRYPEWCDSQASPLPPTRKMQLLQVRGDGATDNVTAQTQCPPADCTSGVDRGTSGNGTTSTPSGQGGGGGGILSGEAAADTACDQHTLRLGTTPLGAVPAGLCERMPPGRPQEDESQLRHLEEQYVHRVYNAIASHFSATRFAIWPAVRTFIDSLPPAAVVADVGCGNGKYFDVRRDIAVLGSDRSDGLVHVAQRRLCNLQGRPAVPNADVLIADGMALPYRRGSCDGALCIAVLHHISSSARRVRFLRSLCSVLRRGGRAVVTVWATEQEDPGKTLHKWIPIGAEGTAAPAAQRALGGGAAGIAQPGGERDGSGSTGMVGVRQDERSAGMERGASVCCGSSASHDNYFVPWNLPFHRAEAHLAALRARGSGAAEVVVDRTSSGPADGGCSAGVQWCGAAQAAGAAAAVGEIDDAKRTVVFKRYYHLFREGELDMLIQSVPGCRVCYSLYDASNWVTVFERTE